MGLLTKAGLFIYIPKCAGLWARKVIHNEIESDEYELYPFHGLYPGIDNSKRIYAIVRHPAQWLRSLFAYRNNIEWEINPKAPPYWPLITALTQPYQHPRWDRFIEKLLRYQPGIVSVVYRLYYHPFIDFYRLEDQLPEFIADLGLDPEDIMKRYPPVHPTANKPELTPEIVKRIEDSESWAMEMFGYG